MSVEQVIEVPDSVEPEMKKCKPTEESHEQEPASEPVVTEEVESVEVEANSGPVVEEEPIAQPVSDTVNETVEESTEEHESPAEEAVLPAVEERVEQAEREETEEPTSAPVEEALVPEECAKEDVCKSDTHDVNEIEAQIHE